MLFEMKLAFENGPPVWTLFAQVVCETLWSIDLYNHAYNSNRPSQSPSKVPIVFKKGDNALTKRSTI